MSSKRIFAIYLIISVSLFILGIFLPGVLRPYRGLIKVESWEYQIAGNDESGTGIVPGDIGWMPVDTLLFNRKNDAPSKTLWLQAVLPDEIKQDDVLYLSPVNTSAEVYIDGVKIVDLGNSEQYRFSSSRWHIVHLQQEHAGGELVLRIRSNYPLYIGLQNDVYIGSNDDVFRSIILRDLLPFGFAFFYILLGFSLIWIHIYDRSFPGALLFAGICFLVSFYTFRYTGIKNLFNLDPGVLDIIGVMQTFFLPLLFILLIQKIFVDRKSLILRFPLLINIVLAVIAPVLTVLLFLFQGKPGFNTVFSISITIRILFQGILLGSGFCVIAYLIKRRKMEDEQAKIVLVGFCCMIGSSISSSLGAAGITLWKFSSHLHIGLFLFVGSFVLAGFIRFSNLRKVYDKHIEQADQIEPLRFDRNGFNLSPRECDVAELVFTGITNKEIGDNLCISERTVKAHLSSIFRKCDVTNKLELVYLLTSRTLRN